MASNGTTLSALKRNWDMVKSAVSDVDEATLSVRPNEDSNSMSWLIWHMARVTDRFIHLRLKNVPQIWSEDSWYVKFNMPDEPDDMGMGWNNEQVSAWHTPSKDILLGYFAAANASADEYISGLSDEDKKLEIPWTQPPGLIIQV